MTAIDIGIYCLAATLMAYSFASLLQRSEFSILVLTADIGFFFGAMIYPVLLAVDLIAPGVEGEGYIARNGLPAFLVAFHVLLYALGCAIGLHLGRVGPTISAAATVTFSRTLAPDYRSWNALLLLGLAAWALYFWLVGIETALATAVLHRGGDFEGMEEGRDFLFLKTLASIALYAVCAIPVALERKGTAWFIAVFFISVLIWFANTVSRNAVLFFVIAPLLIYVYRVGAKSFVKPALILAGMLTGGIFILLFGKSIGWVIRGHVTGSEEFDLAAAQYGGNVLEAYLRNVEHLWYSMAAGIHHFMNHGPLTAIDPVLGVLGFIPSPVFDSLMLQELDYRRIEISMTCLNTESFGNAFECTVPPFWTGYSAYLLPLAGGFFFGAVRYLIFGVLEDVWIRVSRLGTYHTWPVYFLTLLAIAFMSLIPSVISQATAAGLFALSLYAGRYVSQAMLSAPKSSTKG